MVIAQIDSLDVNNPNSREEMNITNDNLFVVNDVYVAHMINTGAMFNTIGVKQFNKRCDFYMSVFR